MGLHSKGIYQYGDSQDDLHDYLNKYSEANDYPIKHVADAICRCGNKVFRLCVDNDAGVASRTCGVCQLNHLIGDSEEFLADADLEECACPCGNEALEISVGVALYQASEALKWVYVGARCPKCRLVGCYGDWKNEFEPYQDYLALV